jgi:hypothetical protein
MHPFSRSSYMTTMPISYHPLAPCPPLYHRSVAQLCGGGGLRRPATQQRQATSTRSLGVGLKGGVGSWARRCRILATQDETDDGSFLLSPAALHALLSQSPKASSQSRDLRDQETHLEPNPTLALAHPLPRTVLTVPLQQLASSSPPPPSYTAHRASTRNDHDAAMHPSRLLLRPGVVSLRHTQIRSTTATRSTRKESDSLLDAAATHRALAGRWRQ